ncbi:MAG TPA: hypothetical protein VGH94_00880 [Acidimicrobiales bacterium]|jgi:hypothetical protein
MDSRASGRGRLVGSHRRRLGSAGLLLALGLLNGCGGSGQPCVSASSDDVPDGVPSSVTLQTQGGQLKTLDFDGEFWNTTQTLPAELGGGERSTPATATRTDSGTVEVRIGTVTLSLDKIGCI